MSSKGAWTKSLASNEWNRAASFERHPNRRSRAAKLTGATKSASLGGSERPYPESTSGRISPVRKNLCRCTRLGVSKVLHGSGTMVVGIALTLPCITRNAKCATSAAAPGIADVECHSIQTFNHLMQTLMQTLMQILMQQVLCRSKLCDLVFLMDTNIGHCRSI